MTEVVEMKASDQLVDELVAKVGARVHAQTDERLRAALQDWTVQLKAASAVGVASPAATSQQGPDLRAFLRAVASRDVKALEGWHEIKDMSGSVGSAGGFLLPQQLETMLLREMAVYDQFAALPPERRPRELTISGRSVTLPLPDVSSGPVGSSTAMAFGAQVYRVAENATVQTTEPKIRQVEIVAHPVAALVWASNELMEDAGNALEQTITTALAQAYADRKLRELLVGTGVGEALGVLVSPATIGVTRVASGDPIEVDDILNMYRRLLPGSHRRAVWFAHPFARSYLAKLQLGSQPAMTWADIRAGLPDTLLGLPIYFTEYLSPPGTENDLLLADWTQYVIVARKGLTFATSTEAGFVKRQTGFLAEARWNGQPVHNAPITLADGAGANTVSPFIRLV